MQPLDVSKVVKIEFPDNQYFKQEFTKDQICIHHTVSGVGIQGDISWWLQTTARVATSLIIHHNGTPYSCFSSKYWGHHLGITSSFLTSKGFPDANVRNELLNKRSIGIEIDSAGGLVEHGGSWYMARWDENTKKNVPNLRVKFKEDQISYYPNGFRGFEAFEKYTPEQIDTLGRTLILWCRGYGIPATYNPDMWDVSNRALQGQKGIWNHTSYRSDKSDCHPQPELVNLLKNLNRWI